MVYDLLHRCAHVLHRDHPGNWRYLVLHPDTLGTVLTELNGAGAYVGAPPYRLVGFEIDVNALLPLGEAMFVTPHGVVRVLKIADQTSVHIGLVAMPTVASKHKPRAWMPTVKHPLVEQDRVIKKQPSPIRAIDWDL
jgi:hypothetical protein